MGAAKVVRDLYSKMMHLDTPLIDNSNIISDHVGRRGLHLNFRGSAKLASNFINMLQKFSD